MRKTFTINIARPAETVKRLAQQAGDRVPKWRANGDLRWKFGSYFGLKLPGKAIIGVESRNEGSSTLTITLRRGGIVDLWGFLRKDYRDFYDRFAPLAQAWIEEE